MMERLIEVYYDPDLCRYRISSRASAEQPWATYEGDEFELDVLLGIARDTMAGG